MVVVLRSGDDDRRTDWLLGDGAEAGDQLGETEARRMLVRDSRLPSGPALPELVLYRCQDALDDRVEGIAVVEQATCQSLCEA